MTDENVPSRHVLDALLDIRTVFDPRSVLTLTLREVVEAEGRQTAVSWVALPDPAGGPGDRARPGATDLGAREPGHPARSGTHGPRVRAVVHPLGRGVRRGRQHHTRVRPHHRGGAGAADDRRPALHRGGGPRCPHRRTTRHGTVRGSHHRPHRAAGRAGEPRARHRAPQPRQRGGRRARGAAPDQRGDPRQRQRAAVLDLVANREGAPASGRPGARPRADDPAARGRRGQRNGAGPDPRVARERDHRPAGRDPGHRRRLPPPYRDRCDRRLPRRPTGAGRRSRRGRGPVRRRDAGQRRTALVRDSHLGDRGCAAQPADRRRLERRPRAAPGPARIGLTSAETRIARLGGSVSIVDDDATEGFTIRARIPL